jgi:PAS domain S-box-containing protein
MSGKLAMGTGFNGAAEQRANGPEVEPEAERELEQLVDAVPQHIVVLAADGRRLHANQVALNYHGLTLQEFLAEVTPAKFVHPEDLERYLNLRQSGIKSGALWAAEIRLRKKDGQFRWFLIRANPLRDERGSVLRWYLAGTDIEERKAAERELRQLIDVVPQYMCVDGTDGSVLYANDRLLDYLGIPLEEAQASDFRTRVFHPEDLDRAQLAREEAISRGVPWEVEARILRKDGQYRCFLIRYNPLRDEQGNIVRWYAAGTDIEDRKRAEQELRQIIDVVPQHIFVLGADGNGLYSNKVSFEYLGIGPEVLQKRSYSGLKKLLHPDDLDRYWDERQKGISRGRQFEMEARFLRKDGQYRWFLLRFNPLRDAQGQVAKWYGTATDIEERKQAEDSLRRSEAYLAEAQRISRVGSFAWKVSSRELFWSEENYRILGYEPGTKPTMELIYQRIHPEDIQLVQRSQERAERYGEDWDLQVRLLMPDGSVKHVRVRAHATRDDLGSLEFVGAAADITEQHESRACLESAFAEIAKLKEELFRENLALKEEIDQASLFEEIVGSSEPLRRVLAQVTRVAPTDSTVLITGETGTGKELIARAIHKRSPRSSRAFVSANCAAIPAALIGSELFGHEKGAFTGATQRRLGRFELAEGGTLFLDEVGDLPAETQIALLRVLQERQLERIGGTQSIAVDVRIIAATNRDLKEAIDTGTFRSDLFYRLNVFPIDVPPLRDRKEDIPMLVEYLTERYAGKIGKKIKDIDQGTLKMFQAYHWPGNIRELQNVIERAVILCDGETLSVDEVWLHHKPSQSGEASKRLARLEPNQEKELIESALLESRGRVAGPSGAAAKLGIPRSTLETKIRSLRIDKHHFKSK